MPLFGEKRLSLFRGLRSKVRSRGRTVVVLRAAESWVHCCLLAASRLFVPGYRLDSPDWCCPEVCIVTTRSKGRLARLPSPNVQGFGQLARGSGIEFTFVSPRLQGENARSAAQTERIARKLRFCSRRAVSLSLRRKLLPDCSSRYTIAIEERIAAVHRSRRPRIPRRAAVGSTSRSAIV